MKKFLIAVISLVIVAMTAYGVAYLLLPVNSVELEKYTHIISLQADDAYIVRDETVYTSQAEGIAYNISTDGDRVAQDSEISTVYAGQVDESILKQLHTIDFKINRLKAKGHDSKLYNTDTEASESEIASVMAEIFDASSTNDVQKAKEIKNEINDIRKKTTVSYEEQLDKLYAERKEVEKQISARSHDIVSDCSGIFSSYIDGLEDKLSPETAELFTPKDIKDLKADEGEYINGKNVAYNTPVCKVMNNHVWYICSVADKDRIKQLKENPDVTVRFTNLTETDVKGEVCHISEPDKDGNSVFMIKVGTYIESAFSYRTVNAEIIFCEYSGYKVPTDSIRTGEGISDYYVYARKGSEAYKCDVEVLYSDTSEGYSIIASTKDADNKLGSMDRLVVGER